VPLLDVASKYVGGGGGGVGSENQIRQLKRVEFGPNMRNLEKSGPGRCGRPPGRGRC
jgi:hypothetical protein